MKNFHDKYKKIFRNLVEKLHKKHKDLKNKKMNSINEQKLSQTLQGLLQHTTDGNFKDDLIQIFSQYYLQFPQKFNEKFADFRKRNNSIFNIFKKNNDAKKTDENSDVKVNLPNIQKITEMLETSLMLPLLATDLMTCLHKEANDIDTKTLAKFIAQEQPVVIRVLRVANSPFYGLSRQVDSLETAIMVLGIRTIRTLVLSITMIGSLQPTTCELFNCDTFWQHSLAVGVISRQLAKFFGDSPELAFTAGLLHDIGRLALAGCFKQEYNQALKYQQQRGCTLLNAEISVLNITHQQIGGILAKNWRLPESLSSVINFHHTPSRISQLQQNQNQDQKTNANLLQLCDIVHLANILTALLKLPEEQNDIDLDFPISELDETTWDRLSSKIKPSDILKLLPKIEQDFTEISQALLG